MMDGFGTGEKDKEVCVVYQDDDQKVQMSYQRIYNIMNNNMNCCCQAILEGGDKLIVERKRDRPMWFSRYLLMFWPHNKYFHHI